MSDFKAKMHQNRLQRSPDPLAVLKGPTSKGKEGEDEDALVARHCRVYQ